LPKLVSNNSIEVEGLAGILAMARLAPILAARRSLKEALGGLGLRSRFHTGNFNNYQTHSTMIAKNKQTGGRTVHSGLFSISKFHNSKLAENRGETKCVFTSNI
jgi:hypothetical protein